MDREEMTLEEVIETLQVWISTADDEYDREEHGRVCGLKEALHEIKKIKPCEDAISRSEAIRVASGYCHWSNIPKELAKLPSVNPIPCEDAISRQAVIDAFEKRAHIDWERLKVLYPLLEEIEQLPPVSVVEKVGRWIPVSERLPEQDKTGCSNWHSVKVFAQIKSNINDVWETEIVKGYFIEFDNEMAFSLEEFPLCIPDGWDFIPLDKDNRAYDEYSERYVELQAWMQLPQPYEPQESEE